MISGHVWIQQIWLNPNLWPLFMWQMMAMDLGCSPVSDKPKWGSSKFKHVGIYPSQPGHFLQKSCRCNQWDGGWFGTTTMLTFSNWTCGSQQQTVEMVRSIGRKSSPTGCNQQRWRLWMLLAVAIQLFCGAPCVLPAKARCRCFALTRCSNSPSAGASIFSSSKCSSFAQRSLVSVSFLARACTASGSRIRCLPGLCRKKSWVEEAAAWSNETFPETVNAFLSCRVCACKGSKVWSPRSLLLKDSSRLASLIQTSMCWT